MAIDPDTRERINDAVRLAMELWLNAHLGEVSRRQDMHSAFKMLRSHASRYGSINAGIAALSENAYRHEDM